MNWPECAIGSAAEDLKPNPKSLEIEIASAGRTKLSLLTYCGIGVLSHRCTLPKKLAEFATARNPNPAPFAFSKLLSHRLH